jgi:two-component system, NarL family, sensor kinase
MQEGTSNLGLLFIGTTFIAFVLGSLLFFIITHRNRVLKLLLSMQEKEIEKEKEVGNAILQGEEKERIRVSEELHDGLGAKLSAIKMQLEANLNSNQVGVEPKEIILQLNQAINELRGISHHLQPEYIHSLGLVNALKQLVQQMNGLGKTHYKFYTNATEKMQLDRESTLHIYRIFSELNTNILHHSQAKEAFCQLILEGDSILISVEDNGIGMRESGKEKAPGIGLINLRKRVEVLNGTLTIDSEKGTSVQIVIPKKA